MAAAAVMVLAILLKIVLMLVATPGMIVRLRPGEAFGHGQMPRQVTERELIRKAAPIQTAGRNASSQPHALSRTLSK